MLYRPSNEPRTDANAREGTGGRLTPKAARPDRWPADHRRRGRHTRPTLGDDGNQGANCAPLTARAKGFEAKADLIHLTPMPEEARRSFFVAGHARDRNAEARPAAATSSSVAKGRDATLKTQEPKQPR